MRMRLITTWIPLVASIVLSPLPAQVQPSAPNKTTPTTKTQTTPAGAPLPSQVKPSAAEVAHKKIDRIFQALMAYAHKNDLAFPEGKNANEAFRKLFVSSLLDDEMFFHIQGDPEKTGKPDGLIGSAKDGYKAAIEAGECDFHYITGLRPDRDDSRLPLAFAKVTGQNGIIYVIVVRVGGKSAIYETTDGIVKEMKGGEMLDIFSEKYGTNPNNIVAPLKKEQKK